MAQLENRRPLPRSYRCPHCQALSIGAGQKLAAYAHAPAQCNQCQGWCYVPTTSRNRVGALSVVLLALVAAIALALGSWLAGVAGVFAVLLTHARRWRAAALLPTTPVAAQPVRDVERWLGLELVGLLLVWLSS